MPSYEYEEKHYAEGYTAVCGCDEAGRGPLCGPVVAAAVILPRGLVLEGLDDSKKLTEKKRERLFDIIKEINRQGVTILLIEQNANMALKIADIAYVLETGEITKSGSGAELLADESIKDAYLGKKKK